MTCKFCNHACQKAGKQKNGAYKFYCKLCGKYQQDRAEKLIHPDTYKEIEPADDLFWPESRHAGKLSEDLLLGAKLGANDTTRLYKAHSVKKSTTNRYRGSDRKEQQVAPGGCSQSPTLLFAASCSYGTRVRRK